ncbi:MAG: family 2 glycosyl transferase [Candidatus Magnetoglobus multicellularis str. Araruama]|uniref:Family 2 glycosyl transferase n=1 Tax=Candidatus Magnetoglobus multicellularis str. Araruama TaxID=890399 RepID=A0A1V1NZQ4_9BACT|nr:MAG: family 2 glycosyl transferase [Candidatus Magnetoglobus multicellularis str. Araruama]
MSSLSNLPYGKILDYWYEKLSGKSYRYKFLLTKTVEVFTFKSHSGNGKNRHNYSEFPKPIQNTVPENPKISIVVPNFLKSEKDKQNIANLLQSIERQTLKPNEVIVIDDCSPINFTFPETVTVCRLEKNSGPAKARNIGKKLAIEKNSDIIAFTDTDCILSENWISTIAKSFLDFKNFQIFSGDTPAYERNWFGTYHNINGTLNGRQLKNSERLLYGTTANLAITREVAANIDFNERFLIAAGEDIEFCFKANKQEYAIKYIPTMIVYHNYGYNCQLTENLKRFREQFKKYGQGEKYLLKEIPNYYAYFDRSEEIQAKINGL